MESPIGNRSAGPFQFRLRTLLVVMTVCGVLFGFLGWLLRAPQRAWQRGWERAEEDWIAQRAVFYGWNDDDYEKPYHFSYQYDPESGLPIWPANTRGTRPFYDGYQASIRDLLKLHGAPPWGLAQHYVTKQELIAALKNKEFREITGFPHDVTPNIVILRGGTIQRWGATMSSGGDSLSVGTPYALIGFGSGGLSATSSAPGPSLLLLGCERQEGKPVFAGQLSNRPDVYFIRGDAVWIAAFLEDGRFLCVASLE